MQMEAKTASHSHVFIFLKVGQYFVNNQASTSYRFAR